MGAAPSRFLILPGLGGSGPGHWQTLWESTGPAFARVQQRDWEHPVLNEWLQAVDDALAAGGPAGPVALVAHSLACALVAHGARRPAWARVAAALLVAPADVDLPRCTPDETRGFAPMPLDPLPFPTTVVASQNDPYVDFTRARRFAEGWRAAFVDAGALGHINAASDLGAWPQGRRWLDQLVARAGGGVAP